MSTSADYRGATAEEIQHHYDLSNEFYALWLDRTMTYSSALWAEPDEPLERAQLRKLDYLAEGARAAGAARVLDVGCGWGSMMKRLVESHGVGHVVGLTLSEAQADSFESWADDRYEVRLENWADHQPEGTYDAIVSIGAFEHFADFGLPRAARVEGYRAFFERCRSWLPLRGRLALQTISKGSNMRFDRATVRDMNFVNEHIFPGSELPWFSEALEASEHRFEVVSARNDPDHYHRTVRHWLDSLRANRDAAVDEVGEEAVAAYERYLRTAIHGFANRHLGLLRIVFERVL